MPLSNWWRAACVRLPCLVWSSATTNKEMTGFPSPVVCTTEERIQPLTDLCDARPGSPSLEKRVPARAYKKDTARWWNQSWKISSAFFFRAVTVQTNFSLPNKFSRNLGSMPKTSTHILSTKHTNGSLVKSFVDVAGVRCWRPPFTGRHFIVFLLGCLCPCRRS